MKIQLIKGHFTAQDAIDLITQMVSTKIKFHENKINGTNNEEDIKMRETRIKELQKNLSAAREYIMNNSGDITIESEIVLG